MVPYLEKRMFTFEVDGGAAFLPYEGAGAVYDNKGPLGAASASFGGAEIGDSVKEPNSNPNPNSIIGDSVKEQSAALSISICIITASI